MEALGGMSALLSMMSHSGYDNCALEDCIWTPTPQYCACQWTMCILVCGCFSSATGCYALSSDIYIVTKGGTIAQQHTAFSKCHSSGLENDLMLLAKTVLSPYSVYSGMTL